MAEAGGFEPPVREPVRQFSKLLVSATHPNFLGTPLRRSEKHFRSNADAKVLLFSDIAKFSMVFFLKTFVLVLLFLYFCTMEDVILNKYLDEIGREQLLSDEEEKRLSARILKGDERALNRLVEANLRFVVAIARQYQGQGLSMEDLVSEGNLGLIKAAGKYDATRGLRFVNYAVVFIRRQIEKALKAESSELRVESGKDGQTRSVDAPLGTKTNMSLLSVLADANAPLTDGRVYHAGIESAVERALGGLNEREGIIINAYFGIGQEHLTMAEIGDVMGLKRERVRQIRDRAVRKLRKAYKAAMSR